LHECARILSVQEPRHVDLHFTSTWTLLFKLIINEANDDVVLEGKQLCDSLINPRLNRCHVYFAHVNLRINSISKLHRLHQLLLFVTKPTVLVGTGATKLHLDKSLMITRMKYCSSITR